MLCVQEFIKIICRIELFVQMLRQKPKNLFDARKDATAKQKYLLNPRDWLTATLTKQQRPYTLRYFCLDARAADKYSSAVRDVVVRWGTILMMKIPRCTIWSNWRIRAPLQRRLICDSSENPDPCLTAEYAPVHAPARTENSANYT
jgi:hypothetical protein